MGRNNQAYEDNILLIRSTFPGRGALYAEEVGRFLGISKRTVYRRYGRDIREGQMMATTLARRMAEPKGR